MGARLGSGAVLFRRLPPRGAVLTADPARVESPTGSVRVFPPDPVGSASPCSDRSHGSGALDGWLFAAAALLTILLAGPALTIPLRIPINYDEGWNAGFDARAVTPGGLPLYPGPGGLVFNNYPPGGFLLVGALGRFVFGDMILAGRTVALAALLAVGALTGVCVRALGASRRAAMVSTLLFLLIAASDFRGYVAMDDPQWLAQAFMMGGLAVLIRGDPAGSRPPRRFAPAAAAGAALLFVAGGTVKHNLLALPGAVTLWLVIRDRRAATIWAATGAAATAIAIGASAVAFGRAAVADILVHERVFRFAAMREAGNALWPLAPAAAIVLARARRRVGRDPAFTLPALFAGFALPLGIAERAGDGVNYNAQFEFAVAVVLAFGVALVPRPAPNEAPPRYGPATLATVAVSPILLVLPGALLAAFHDVTDRDARARAWRPMVERLAAARGTVACEMQSLCFWAGRPFTVDVFNLTQSALVDERRRRPGEPPRPGSPISNWDHLVATGAIALFEEQRRSATHAEARRAAGQDPVLQPLRGARVVLAGPDGAVLLAPASAATVGSGDRSGRGDLRATSDAARAGRFRTGSSNPE